MGRIFPSARPSRLLPFVTLLAALGAIGLRARGVADVQASPGPPVARPSPAPRLTFVPARLELGRLAPDESRPVEVSWRWGGGASPRVVGVDATCGCVVVGALPRRLEPGAAGVLRLAVRAPRRSGPFGAAVRVWLDPAPGPRPPTVALCGHVVGRVGVRPARLVLGPRTPGSRVERRLEVALADGLAGARVRAVLEGLEGDVAVEGPAFAGRAGASLCLALRVPGTPGPFAGRVVLRVDGEPGRVVVPLGGDAVVRR